MTSTPTSLAACTELERLACTRPGLTRIAEVGTLYSVQRGTHRVKIEEVPEHNLSAKPLQLLRSLVRPVGEHPHRVHCFSE